MTGFNNAVHVTATIKSNPNNKVRVRQNDHAQVRQFGTQGGIGGQGIQGIPGLDWQGAFNPLAVYSSPQGVSYQGTSYIFVGTTPQIGSVPSALNPDWDVIAEGVPGILWRGTYSAGVQYELNDAVAFNGSSYIFTGINPAIGISPPNPAVWDVVADAGADSDKNFTFIQGTASATWTITHNLAKNPSITIVDSGGNEVEGDITYVDLNTLILNFSAVFSGRAYLN